MNIDDVLALIESGVDPVEVGRQVAESEQLTIVPHKRKTAMQLNQEMYDQLPPDEPSGNTIISQIQIAYVADKITDDQYAGLYEGITSQASGQS